MDIRKFSESVYPIIALFANLDQGISCGRDVVDGQGRISVVTGVACRGKKVMLSSKHGEESR